MSRSTYGAPLRIVTNVVKLTAALIAEIEARLWKSLKVENLEKVKKLIGEALEVTKVAKLRGESEATSQVVGFRELAGIIVRAGVEKGGGPGAVFLGATSAENMLGGSESDNYEPERLANFYAILPATPGGATFTGWIPPGLTPLTAAPRQGLVLVLYNNRPTGSGENIVLVVNSAKSEAKNRFEAAGVEIVLEPHQSAVFIYQGEEWRLAART